MKYLTTSRKFSKIRDRILKGPELKIKNESFGKIMLQSLQNGGNKIAVTDASTKESVTYNQLLHRTISLAQHLKNFGIKKNDVISINSENSINFSISAIAALYLGIITAPISQHYTEKELIHAMNISKPKIIFCSDLVINKIINVAPELQFIEKVILLNKTNRNIPKSVLKFDDLVNLPPTENFEVTAVEVEHTAAILCSSGTTGLPKGVMITHQGLISSHHFFSHPEYCNYCSKEVGFSLIPFYHVYGYVSLFCMLTAHMKLISLPKFEENEFLKSLQNYCVTYIILIPPLALFLSKSPEVSKYDLSKLKDSICGAAPLAQELQESVMKRLGLNIRQGFGSTETIVTNVTLYNTVKYNTIGKLAPGMECKVIDMKTGEALGPNEKGELCFRGVQIMKGYVGNPEATAAAIDEDGWFHTGDIGYYDEEENFYIVDRYKELIKYKGYQVPPAEIEGILFSHPEVLDCAVIGKPDEEAGELPTAFIVRKPNAKITAKEIHDLVAQNFSVHKKLRGGVRFIEAIPKNPSGKVLKRILREQLTYSNE